MSRFLYITGIMIGMTLLFYFGGVLSDTNTSRLLDYALYPESSLQFDIGNIIFASIAAIGLVAAIVTSFVTRDVTVSVMTAVVIFYSNLLFDFVAVFQVIAAQNRVLALLVIGPVFVMYGIILIDWWRGYAG